MSYENKTPSVRAKLPIDLYNRLIELLTKVENVDLKDVREKGPEIKEKLLKYSEPKNGDVDLGLYPSQVYAVLYILLENARPITISNDYYRILLDNRKKYAEWKNRKEGE